MSAVNFSLILSDKWEDPPPPEELDVLIHDANGSRQEVVRTRLQAGQRFRHWLALGRYSLTLTPRLGESTGKPLRLSFRFGDDLHLMMRVVVERGFFGGLKVGIVTQSGAKTEQM